MNPYFHDSKNESKQVKNTRKKPLGKPALRIINPKAAITFDGAAGNPEKLIIGVTSLKVQNAVFIVKELPESFFEMIVKHS